MISVAQIPKPSKVTRYFVPRKPYAAVARHAVDNLAGDPDAAPIMALYGPSGEGKTVVLSEILKKLNIRAFEFEAADFESADAGRPAEAIRAALEEAGMALRSGEASACVFNDIDLGIGEYGGVQYTVNRQLVTLGLMSWCDRFAGAKRRPRPPVYLTCNRLDVLHGPLLREMRCEVLAWRYTAGERREIVRRIFPHLPPNQVAELLATFPNQPIAFFKALVRAGRREVTDAQLRATDPIHAVRLAVAGEWRVPDAPPSLTELIRLGKESLASRAARPVMGVEECL